MKNQGNYGSCYAFTTVAAVEALLRIRTGQSVILSEQLIDCDKTNQMASWKKNDKEGGCMSLPFEYIKRKGLTERKNYPYIEGYSGACHIKKIKPPLYKIDGYRYISTSPISLMRAVLRQPICVGISFDLHKFQRYQWGLYGGKEYPNTTFFEHSMLLVGYHKMKNGRIYWILKNSFGSKWGEKGYMNLLSDHGRFLDGKLKEALYIQF